MNETLTKELLIEKINSAENSAEVYVRVNGTSPCVNPIGAFVDEDDMIQIILPEDSMIGK